MTDWIKVQDGLPELNGYGNSEKVMICMGSTYISCGRLDTTSKTKKVRWIHSGTGDLAYDVTHWMPLPDPPKEQV